MTAVTPSGPARAGTPAEQRQAGAVHHGRDAGLDGLRGIAILMVIACHACGVAGLGDDRGGWLSTALFSGVVLFFALSGYLIYRPFAAAHAAAQRSPKLGDYAVRRAVRILPAYWIALIALSIWPGTAGDVFGADLWRFALLFSGYSDRTLTQGLGITWSLSAEVAFYAALPLLALLARGIARRSTWWQGELAMIAVFAVAGLVLRAFTTAGSLPPWTANALLTTTVWFAGGMLLALLSVARDRGSVLAERLATRIARRGGACWIGAVVALMFAFRMEWLLQLLWTEAELSHLWIVIAYSLANTLVVGLAAALALAPVVCGSGGVVGAVTRWRTLTLVGIVSYGLFLWHMPLLVWLGGIVPGVAHGPELHGAPALFVVGLALALVPATASWLLVERPLLRRTRARSARRA